MDYEKELTTLQTWIKQATGLNSWKLSEMPAKLARPVIVWEPAKRSLGRNITNYAYTIDVRQYGKMYVANLNQAMQYQEVLLKDLAERGGAIPIVEDGATLGYLKAVNMEFTEGETLDIIFSISYQATYSRTKPTPAPNATKVGNNITLRPRG
jgi:hypothetical protein